VTPAGSTPSRSVMLYKSALALTCDEYYERALEQKLHRIDEQLSQSGANPPDGTALGDEEHAVAGRYTIVDELGRGANGVVYRAVDQVLGREVALKELPVQLSNDEHVAPRFRQEARALAKLNHPNIVQVYDFIEHRKRMWMAIELVEGGNLASYLSSRECLSTPEACRLGSEIAVAVAFAHDRGVIHRDLKPLNVLLAGESTPKVTDFGLAKLAEGGVDTLEGTVMGSPHYMSPEQAEGGSITHSTDIYSLGVIMYQMLTGRVPFEGEIASVLAQHIRKPPRRLRDVAPERNIPPKLEKLVLAMLAKSRDDRPPEMREVAADAGPLVEGFPGGFRGAGMLVAKGDPLLDEVADRLDASPARRGVFEQAPGRLGQQIGFAIPAPQQEHERLLGKILHPVLLGRGSDPIRLARIVHDRVG